MDLQHHCLSSVGEPVDQSDPPQRPAPVQTLGGESGTGSIEFHRPTRIREDRVVKVICQVEVGVLGKHGMSQAEGNRNDSPPERRKPVESGGKVPAQVIKGEVTAGTCSKQPEDDAMHRLLGHLQTEE
jgi:hypothetical protein